MSDYAKLLEALEELATAATSFKDLQSRLSAAERLAQVNLEDANRGWAKAKRAEEVVVAAKRYLDLEPGGKRDLMDAVCRYEEGR